MRNHDQAGAAIRVTWIGAMTTALLALALAACGSDQGDRIASGAGVGAASGAAVGAVFGGVGAIPGALIGAGVGGVSGGVTDEKEVDLGKPVWR